MASIAALGLIGLGVYFALKIYKRVRLAQKQSAFAASNGCKPATSYFPLRDPFLGLDFVIPNVKAFNQSRALDRVCELYNTYGNTFFSRMFALKVVWTCEPENIKTFLSVRFKEYETGHRAVFLRPLVGTSIFASDGDEWAHSRALLRPNFTKDQVANLHIFEDHLKDLLARIPRDGSSVDLQELFFRFTLDSATEFLFGESSHSLQQKGRANDDGARFAEAFTISQREIVLNMRLGPLRFLRSQSQFQEATRYCLRYADDLLERVSARMKTGSLEEDEEATKRSHPFLEDLLKQTSDKQRLRGEMLSILLAGRDTTATLLGNLFFALARHPKAWEKLRAEVATLNGDLPTYEVMKNMTYLKYCLNEANRLYSIVGSNSRRAIVDTVLPVGGGPDGRSPVFVPKGTVVFWHNWALHRRKDIWGEDANEFRPERWESARPGWDYIPFNGGPRSCIGQQYALIEASYVTVRLLQHFKGIESRDSEPWVEQIGTTISSRNGTKVSLTPA